MAMDFGVGVVLGFLAGFLITYRARARIERFLWTYVHYL